MGEMGGRKKMIFFHFFCSSAAAASIPSFSLFSHSLSSQSHNDCKLEEKINDDDDDGEKKKKKKRRNKMPAVSSVETSNIGG